MRFQLAHLFDRFLIHCQERDQLKSQLTGLSDDMHTTKSQLLKNTTKNLYDVNKLDEVKDIEDKLIYYREFSLTILRSEIIDLIAKNGSTAIYEFLKQFDQEGWCLYRACETLIQGNIYTYFYAKDNMGHFEESDGYDLTYWKEVMKYGDCYYEIQGSYEILKSHTLNSQQSEYIEYQTELHKRAAIGIIEKHLGAIVIDYPDLLTFLEEKCKSSSDIN